MSSDQKLPFLFGIAAKLGSLWCKFYELNLHESFLVVCIVEHLHTVFSFGFLPFVEIITLDTFFALEV